MTQKNSGFNTRLKQLIDNQNINILRFSKLVDISNGVIHKAISGDHKLSMDNLEKISTKTSVNLHWLITGEGNMYTAKGLPVTTLNFEANFAVIPRQELSKFTKSGATGVSEKIYWPFNQTVAGIILEVSDNSLEPAFKRFEFVVAEMVNLPVPKRELHVFRTLNQVVIRYVESVTDDKYLLAAPNPDYPKIEIAITDIVEVYKVASKFTHNF